MPPAIGPPGVDSQEYQIALLIPHEQRPAISLRRPFKVVILKGYEYPRVVPDMCVEALQFRVFGKKIQHGAHPRKPLADKIQVAPPEQVIVEHRGPPQ